MEINKNYSPSRWKFLIPSLLETLFLIIRESTNIRLNNHDDKTFDSLIFSFLSCFFINSSFLTFVLLKKKYKHNEVFLLVKQSNEVGIRISLFLFVYLIRIFLSFEISIAYTSLQGIFQFHSYTDCLTIRKKERKKKKRLYRRWLVCEDN